MLDVRMLGPLEAVVDESPAVLGGPRQRALLALLALRGNHVVPASELVSKIWGDDSPDTAYNTLQVYIAKLRKVLEPARAHRGAGTTLVTRDPGYLFRVDELDADRFEAAIGAGRALLTESRYEDAQRILSDALSLWRGPALVDLAGYLFVHGPSLRLEELRLAALEDRLEAEVALGRTSAAAAELESLLADHPYRERLYQQLMIAQYRGGRQAEALQTFQRARRVMVEELGIDPTPRLVELERAILEHDPSLAVEAVPASPVVVRGSHPSAPAGVNDLPGDTPSPAVESATDRYRAPVTVVHVCADEERSLVAEDPESVPTQSIAAAASGLEDFGATLLRIAPSFVAAGFGWHGARADDARRALVAALDVTAAGGLRAGVASGHVLRPESGDDGGDVARVASSLAEAAPTSRVVSDLLSIDRCRTPVRHSIDGDMIVVAGFAPPSTTHHRFVGRERELELIDVVLRQTLDLRTPHIVAVSGPPGVGKSRLIAELADRWPEVHTFRAFVAPDRHTDSLNVLRALIAVVADEPPTEAVATVFEAAHALQQALAAQEQPVLLVIDDADGLPPTALELVCDTLAALTGLPILAVLSGAELALKTPALNTLNLALTGLAAIPAADLACDLVPGIDATVAGGLAQRCGGNPLLLEALLHTEADGSGGGTPRSVELALRAWIDRVPAADARVLGYVSAAPDGVDPNSIWQQPLGMEPSTIHEALLRLQRHDLLIRSATDSRLRPRHALLGEHAVARLAKDDRIRALLNAAATIADPGSSAQVLMRASALQREFGDPAWLSVQSEAASKSMAAAWRAVRSGDRFQASEYTLASVLWAWESCPSGLEHIALLGLFTGEQRATSPPALPGRGLRAQAARGTPDPGVLLELLGDDRGRVVRAAYQVVGGHSALARALLDEWRGDGVEPGWTRHAEAIRSLTRAPELPPSTLDGAPELSSASAWFHRARSARAVADPSSVTAWRELIAVLPPVVPRGPIHLYAALAAAMHGHIAEAEQQLDRAAAPAKAMVEYPIAMAWLAVRRGDAGACEAATTAVRNLASDDPLLAFESQALLAVCGDNLARDVLCTAGEPETVAAWLAVVDQRSTT